MLNADQNGSNRLWYDTRIYFARSDQQHDRQSKPPTPYYRGRKFGTITVSAAATSQMSNRRGDSDNLVVRWESRLCILYAFAANSYIRPAILNSRTTQTSPQGNTPSKTPNQVPCYWWYNRETEVRSSTPQKTTCTCVCVLCMCSHPFDADSIYLSID